MPRPEPSTQTPNWDLAWEELSVQLRHHICKKIYTSTFSKFKKFTPIIHKVNFYLRDNNFTQVLLVTNMISVQLALLNIVSPDHLAVLAQ